MTANISPIRRNFPGHLIVMSNRMIEAWHSMTPNEKRIFYLASPAVRDGLQEGDDFYISGADFARACNIDIRTAYDGLQDAANRLYQRQVSYIDEVGARVRVRWIYRIKYREGKLSVAFPREVIVMLSVFNEQNPYTKLSAMALQLRGGYAQRFYELFRQYAENIGERLLSLTELRDLFELKNKYQKLADLKKRVIDPAIAEINATTDILVDFKAVKSGRTVTGYQFVISLKKQAIDVSHTPELTRDVDTPNFFTGLTEKQAAYFSALLANDAQFGNEYAAIGEELIEFAERIKTHLAHPEKVEKYMVHLVRLGFKKAGAASAQSHP